MVKVSNKVTKAKFMTEITPEINQLLETNLSDEDIRSIWDIMQKNILKHMRDGKEVLFTGFGNFFLQKHAGHPIQFDSGKSKIEDYVNLKFTASNKLNTELRQEFRQGRIKACKNKSSAIKKQKGKH